MTQAITRLIFSVFLTAAISATRHYKAHIWQGETGILQQRVYKLGIRKEHSDRVDKRYLVEALKLPLQELEEAHGPERMRRRRRKPRNPDAKDETWREEKVPHTNNLSMTDLGEVRLVLPSMEVQVGLAELLDGLRSGKAVLRLALRKLAHL